LEAKDTIIIIVITGEAKAGGIGVAGEAVGVIILGGVLLLRTGKTTTFLSMFPIAQFQTKMLSISAA